MGPLSPYRVIDLTDDRGNLAGLIFAQLGAEVVAVEPPHGHRTRRMAPFADDRPGTARSLVHRAYNRGKKSPASRSRSTMSSSSSSIPPTSCSIAESSISTSANAVKETLD